MISQEKLIEETKPSNEELAKFIEEIARNARFKFRAIKPHGLIIFESPEHYYWQISGEFPLIIDGKNAVLRRETRDAYYINALGRATDPSSMFKPSFEDGLRRILDVEDTLIMTGSKIGCKYENGYYATEVFRNDSGRKKSCPYSPFFGDGKDIRSKLEEVYPIVRIWYDNLFKILGYPNYWAQENYPHRENIPTSTLTLEINSLKQQHAPFTERVKRLFGMLRR